uniref:Putative tail protein n=1 Tax=viral metagenome TaxID=1070528 RepID=A0A6H2A4Q2_9ZZZZ
MAGGSIKTGSDCTVYYATVAESPSWTALSNVRSAMITPTVAEIEATSYGDAGWSSSEYGLRKVTGSLEILRDASNAGWLALRTAWSTRVKKMIKIIDDAGVGADGYGVSGTVLILNFADNGPAGDGVTTTVDFTFDGEVTIVSPA